jgi:predicted ATP-dependent protease
VRIEELHRAGGIPIAGAPKPVAIPLDVKVAIVGAPKWYYAFFSVDPEFRSYFKIKADMDSEMAATPENLGTLAALILQSVERNWRLDCEPEAVQRLLGQAARWAGDRGKLSARIELLEDTLSEAAQLLPKEQTKKQAKAMTEAAVKTALENRQRRNARVEDRLHESIAEGTVMIDTGGAVRGQVNALTVRDLGDHAFGTPSRVTARASVGRRGVINIERDIAMSGPIQQKGVMVLQGFLAGRFAQRFPLSFNCSITFEQSYGGVEGDSASMAELIAVVSDIAGLPVRQDVAITGSVNQRGQSQAVGGVHHKVEGFFRTCMDAGGLSGTQGVVVPAANEPNLVLNDEVSAAVAAGRFHVWSVKCVDQAIELMLGVPAGEADAGGAYPPETVYGKVAERLAEFDRIMAEREGAGS